MRLHADGALKKSVAVFLALAMAGGLFCAPVFADTAADAGQTGQQTDGELSLSQQREHTFAKYLREIEGKPDATDRIELDFAQGTLGGKAAIEDYEGQSNVVVLNEEDSVELKFSVATAGVYYFELLYCPVAFKTMDIELETMIDGQYPYADAQSISLKRTWKDKTEILRDAKDNDLVPKQEEAFQWQNKFLKDFNNYVNEEYRYYFEPGEHTIRFVVGREAVALKTLTLKALDTIPTYAQVKSEYDAKGYQAASVSLDKIQAERTYLKTDSVLTPTYDRSSPATEPYHVSKIRRNTIGQDAWGRLGMSISYKIEVTQAGLYDLGMKYRQCYQVGVATSRNIYVDGVIPFQEAKNVKFDYSDAWQYKTLTDEQGNPCYVYLSEGEHVISFEATLGVWNNVLQEVDVVNKKLNDLYRQIIMITSANPDPYRDYRIQQQLPDLIPELQTCADELYACADQYDELNGSKASQSETLRRSADRIGQFVAKPKEIQTRLEQYKAGISGVSAWIQECSKQPLEFDYLLIAKPGEEKPNSGASFWAEISHFFGSFFASFFEDYNTFDENESNQEAIRVWVSDGRDQTQLIKDMVNDSFSPNTKIPVNLSLIQGGLIEATLAGIGPDVALNVTRAQPVNFASRGILTALDGLDGFEEVKDRFYDDALVPYMLDGETYAIPTKQTFQMMFYRKDVFEELGLKIPTTWDAFKEIITTLQRSNMEVRLPYSEVTAAGVQEGGIGVKDMFATIYLQQGSALYDESMSTSLLDTQAGIKAFQEWTDYYKTLGVPLTADFQSRFRNGEMPLGIDNVEMYNVLSATGSEVRGLWAMAPVPGTVNEDGTVNYSSGASGNASVIMTRDPDKVANSWEFLKWYSSTDTQLEFGIQIENLLGPAARWMTANKEAFTRLPWTRTELETLQVQQERIVELPEIPGGYFLPRCIDSAFRDVHYKDKNPREVWLREMKMVNSEIDRKNKELKIGPYRMS